MIRCWKNRPRIRQIRLREPETRWYPELSEAQANQRFRLYRADITARLRILQKSIFLPEVAGWMVVPKSSRKLMNACMFFHRSSPCWKTWEMRMKMPTSDCPLLFWVSAKHFAISWLTTVHLSSQIDKIGFWCKTNKSGPGFPKADASQRSSRRSRESTPSLLNESTHKIR